MKIIFCTDCGLRLPPDATLDDPRCPDCQAGRTRRHARHGDSGAVPRATIKRLLDKHTSGRMNSFAH